MNKSNHPSLALSACDPLSPRLTASSHSTILLLTLKMIYVCDGESFNGHSKVLHFPKDRIRKIFFAVVSDRYPFRQVLETSAVAAAGELRALLIAFHNLS